MSPKKVGIVSYGSCVPKYRITVEEISKQWGTNAENYKKGLGLTEKTVPGLDEDTVTLAVNASKQAYGRVGESRKIGSIYVGSESHPYAVKPTASIVGESLGIGENWTGADLEFACKAGTAGLQIIVSQVESGWVENGLAVGSDTAQGAPGDALEYSAGAGAAAFIVGSENVIASIEHMCSVTTDTPDFWRREKQEYPKHGSRFTGEPAYFKHVVSSTKRLLSETDSKVSDFDHIIFHMPNGKFPLTVAKILNVGIEQLKSGFVVKKIGNTYSACSMLGLVSVLDKCKPGEKILLTSYGSGAGSDSFYIKINEDITSFRENIKKYREFDKTFEEQIENKIYLTYGQYIRHTGNLQNEG